MARRDEAVILFTAFEPSGDAHAASVVAELARRGTAPPVYACGGPKMAEAGARLLERSVDLGAMGLDALRRYRAFRELLGRIRSWSRDHRVLVHVPVDSPAANFPLARLLKRSGARIVHLVAPQMWAWGAWRVGRLRRLTSGVLCLLPFEEQWFLRRGVPAKFIGHFAVNRRLDLEALRRQGEGLQQGSPRLGLFPGSRSHEAAANWTLLLEVFAALRGEHPRLAGAVGASSPAIAAELTRRAGPLPEGLCVSELPADAVIGWCDVALAVSGTITLDVALQRRPMVGVYVTGRASRLAARMLVRTPDRLLPNIVAGRRVVPEFVPHDGRVEPVLAAVRELLAGGPAPEAQRAALEEVCRRFEGHDPAREAADLILGAAKTTA
jgi:lipid-A-disaccharide synthase